MSIDFDSLELENPYKHKAIMISDMILCEHYAALLPDGADKILIQSANNTASVLIEKKEGLAGVLVNKTIKYSMVAMKRAGITEIQMKAQTIKALPYIEEALTAMGFLTKDPASMAEINNALNEDYLRMKSDMAQQPNLVEAKSKKAEEVNFELFTMPGPKSIN